MVSAAKRTRQIFAMDFIFFIDGQLYKCSEDDRMITNRRPPAKHFFALLQGLSLTGHCRPAATASGQTSQLALHHRVFAAQMRLHSLAAMKLFRPKELG